MSQVKRYEERSANCRYGLHGHLTLVESGGDFVDAADHDAAIAEKDAAIDALTAEVGDWKRISLATSESLNMNSALVKELADALESILNPSVSSAFSDYCKARAALERARAE